ncbi:MAG: ABC transporter ATP-binding protein [Eubacterium sp.]|nr:ABC transporter ATP-binding protein [Eubacterium sp.]
MSNFKMVFKMYREIAGLDKKIEPVAFSNALITATRPFINIYFTSKIIALLSNGASFKSLLFYICIAVALNFLLVYSGSFLNDYYQVLANLLFDKENFKMAAKIFNTEYETLEDGHFRDTIHKHEEAGASRWARFSYFMWTSHVFVSGVYTIIVSVIMIMPLLKIGFTKTGDTFFEKPVFLIALIGVIAAMAVIMLLIAIKMNKSYLAANEAYATLDRLFYSFINIFGDYKTGKEIRIYKEQNLINHIATDKILTDGEKTLKQISMRTAKTSSVVAIMGAMVAFGVYVFIGVKGNFGLFDIGSLVMYCGAFMQIINGVMQVANTLGKLAEILPLAKVYFEIIEHKDNKEYGSAEFDTEKVEIEFKNVSFMYPGTNNYALQNVSLKIKNGEHLAVVGRNGSGKTTFIKLMCRLYDVTEGEILINGINIKEYSKESIIRLYSVVFQDFKMFSIPLKDNVCAGEKCNKDRLYSCLDNSNALDRVAQMPKKEDTYLYKDIDENGVEISGGEAQKLALARALYKDSPVVILDEPTAALDPVAENEIYNRFNTFVDNKTAIYISHRLSSCVFCTRIAVFDKSQLVEIGTHQELLNSNGKYSELWNAQAKYYV